MDTPTPALDSARTADDVDRLAAYLYGSGASRWGTGVLHPTSVWRGPRGTADQPLTLRLGEQTPDSPWDLFALGLARARADAIITSGRNLRSEDDLRHDLLGPGSLPEALADWRSRAGKRKPPLSLVMSQSGEIDLTHPLFDSPGRVVIYTGEKGAWRLDSRAADAGVEVQAVPDPTPQGAIDFARAAFGCATISIETGPSISRQLYDEPTTVDEVLLSTYLGGDLPTAARGGRQVAISELESRFDRPAPATTIDASPDQDGAWRFERLVRRS